MSIDLRASIADAFPAIDLDAELRKASLWCLTHPAERKTAKGMPRFLSGWMGRVKPADAARSGGDDTPGAPQPSADALAYAAELEAEIRAKDTPAHV